MTDHNFSQDEIDHFNHFAKDWWDPQGSMKPLHLLNPLRYRYIEQHTSISGKKILDVGCGGGLLSERLAQAGAEVTGIDLSEAALTLAKTHAKTNHLQIDYQKTTVEAFAATHPETFDLITCMEMLEHVPDPSAVIQACAHAVRPQGLLFFSTINRSMKAYIEAILGAEYILRLLPKGTHTYSKFIRPSELDAAARHAGLKLIDFSGIGYNPFTESFKLKADLSVNYLCCYMKDTD